MDYQCECGEEFDIYAVDTGRRDWDSCGDTIIAYFTVRCPKCNKKVSCEEYFTYDRTEIVI